MRCHFLRKTEIENKMNRLISLGLTLICHLFFLFLVFRMREKKTSPSTNGWKKEEAGLQELSISKIIFHREWERESKWVTERELNASKIIDKDLQLWISLIASPVKTTLNSFSVKDPTLMRHQSLCSETKPKDGETSKAVNIYINVYIYVLS